jgi:hypothetical protein
LKYLNDAKQLTISVTIIDTVNNTISRVGEAVIDLSVFRRILALNEVWINVTSNDKKSIVATMKFSMDIRYFAESMYYFTIRRSNNY